MKKPNDSSLVNVAALKSQLAKYLRMVRSGKEVVVTDHRQPVARLVPYEALGSIETIKAKGPFSDVTELEVAPLNGVSTLDALSKERGKR